jgi:hypothetical protein
MSTEPEGLPQGEGAIPTRQGGCSVPSRIFVFGSNLAGRHGKGAALHARQHCGAIYGQGIGLQGRSYAIPTKDGRLNTLPLPVIRRHVEQFRAFAARHPELTFEVTAIGCGLAGYTPEEIAPLFRDAPANCVLPDAFQRCLRARSGEPPMTATPEDDDIWDSLFHGCAFAAWLDEAAARRGPPDPEATKRRAYRYYEEALAEKNRRASSPAPADPELALAEPEAAG